MSSAGSIAVKAPALRKHHMRPLSELRAPASLRAESNRAKFVVQQRTTQANLERTVSGIMKELPSASAKHAEQATREYLEAIYAQNGRPEEAARPGK